MNVTLLFSREQYLAAADAYLRGVEWRIQAGLRPDVCSVASVFISRWDKATMGKVPAELQDNLGIAVAKQTYEAYRQLLDSPRWLRLANAGARPQRLLWASTGTKNSGRVQAPKIRSPQMFSTSRRLPHRLPSIRFLMPRYTPLPTMGSWESSCPLTGEMLGR